mgnify:CR=1 FL=1
MSKRKDGMETRDRLLKVACQVFSEKGFQGATIAEISHRAGANIASINYHFGDKKRLYVEAWRHVCEYAMALYPTNLDVSSQRTVEEMFRDHILSLLNRMTDTSRLGMFHRLMMLEINHPTDLIDDVHRELIRPIREHLLYLIRELLGPMATDENVAFCELSVFSQCRGVSEKKRSKNTFFDFSEIKKASTEDLADHIIRFSLAGIRAVRESRAETAADAG